jgi:hypothetical protein
MVGDVSGKGLKAAMTVSLIVGALRTLALHAAAGGEILQGLNRRLIGRIDGGVTCVVLHIAAHGETMVANGASCAFPRRKGAAGHGRVATGALGAQQLREFTFRLHEQRDADPLHGRHRGGAEQRGELFGFRAIDQPLATRPDVGRLSTRRKPSVSRTT